MDERAQCLQSVLVTVATASGFSVLISVAQRINSGGVKMSIRKQFALLSLLLCFFSVASRPASAVPLVVESSTPGGFHTMGDTWYFLGLFRLDTTRTSTYDPDTGELNVFFNVFTDWPGYDFLGTAIGRGNIPGANLNGNTGEVAGTIEWEVTIPTYSFFLTVLNVLYGPQEGNTYHLTHSYLDFRYAGFSGPNTWNNNQLSLWGADGYSETSQDFYPTYIGSDINIRTGEPIPEPTTLSMLALAALAHGGRRYRRRKSLGVQA